MFQLKNPDLSCDYKFHKDIGVIYSCRVTIHKVTHIIFILHPFLDSCTYYSLIADIYLLLPLECCMKVEITVLYGKKFEERSGI